MKNLESLANVCGVYVDSIACIASSGMPVLSYFYEFYIILLKPLVN